MHVAKCVPKRIMSLRFFLVKYFIIKFNEAHISAVLMLVCLFNGIYNVSFNNSSAISRRFRFFFVWIDFLAIKRKRGRFFMLIFVVYLQKFL